MRLRNKLSGRTNAPPVDFALCGSSFHSPRTNMPMTTYLKAILMLAASASAAFSTWAQEPPEVQRRKVPSPPWPSGDERGMANQIGPATYQRCAWHMSQPGAIIYELSQVRSNTMPLSPFTGPYQVKPKPTTSIPGTAHAFKSEPLNQGAEPGPEGSKLDAQRQFGTRSHAQDGKGAVEDDKITSDGGYPQQHVKPTPHAPLPRLGMDKVPPLVTSALLLDAKAFVGGGKPMNAGELVTAKHIEGMLKAQGLARRGVLPGDVVYVYTG